MTLPTEPECRAALQTRDARFDGRFVYAVVTTGVYCKPSCAARPARPENVRFFETAQAAESAGFRACKRCRPHAAEDEGQRLRGLAEFIQANASDSLSLAALAKQVGMSPTHLQRRFTAMFGVSPKAMQDSARMRGLKQALRKGSAVTDAIYAAGFGSTSRLYGEATRNLGMTPSVYRSGGDGERIAYTARRTAIGLLMMAATEKGVCFAQFGDSAAQLLAQLHDEFPKAELLPSEATHAPALDDWISALDAHVSAGAVRPDLPLDLRGTAFQIRVWRFLLGVKAGEVISYSELAQGIEAPTAQRAAASACAANRIAVLIPCHRVIRGDGGLGGYRWGLERKRVLLDDERARAAVPR